MPEPLNWRSPSSGGTNGASGNYSAHLCQAGDYWFAFSFDGTGVLQLRYATDPAGAWSTATLPAAPTGYGNALLWCNSGLVTTDGTTYAFLVRYNGTPNTYRVIHATNPGGTWSSHALDGTDTYEFVQSGGLVYADGYWVACGYEPGGTIKPLLHASTTVNGTYTAYTSSTETGYAAGWSVAAIVHDGSQWVSVGINGTASGSRSLRYSTDLLSGWTTPGVSPFSSATSSVQHLRTYRNGWYVVRASTFWYTADLTGAWTNDSSAFGLPFCRMISWQNGYWLAAGADTSGAYDTPIIGYLASPGSPAGTYSQITGGFAASGTADADVYGMWGANGYAVASVPFDGQLRYYKFGSTTLRQRQSPRRSPSRVGHPTLRNRQTPYIR